MGKRGPAKRPTNLTVLSGETRPSRVNQNEPEPPDGLPEPPEDMGDEARAVWDRLVPVLDQMRVISPADADALACLCEAVVIHRGATEELERNGLLVTGAMGGLIRNPAWTMQRDAAVLIRAYAREFGLTPSARSELSVGGKTGGGSGAERYLS